MSSFTNTSAAKRAPDSRPEFDSDDTGSGLLAGTETVESEMAQAGVAEPHFQPQPHGMPSNANDEKIMDMQTEKIYSRSRNIPSTFRESLSAWWASDHADAEESEGRLLSRMPFFRNEGQSDVKPNVENPDPITARVVHVPVGVGKQRKDGKRYINTVTFTTPSLERKEKEGLGTGGEGKKATVLLHGYGAGLAFFYLNMETIARASVSIGRKAYALDWLGMGRSSRPDPKELHSGKKATTEQRVEKAERFFTDSLEQWREEQGIDQMTLIGHSLGGYLSTVYALQYPSRVDRLILLSPAGIPNQAEDPGNGASASASASAADKPASVDATASATHNAARELTEPQQETQHGGPLTEVNQIKIHSNGNTGGGKSQTTTDPIQKIDAGDISSSASIEKKSSRSSSASDPPSPSKVPAPKGPPPLARKFITYMWDSGFSPFSLIRAFGPWGPLFVGKYSSRRFGSLSPDDTRDLHGYIWTISRAKGSSEYCISHLLAPGAYARMPLVERVDKLKIPVTFVYGDKDWMDPKGGLESIERMKKAGNDAGKLVMIKNAGHHLYLDNAKVSNRMLTEEITAAATPKEKEGRT